MVAEAPNLESSLDVSVGDHLIPGAAVLERGSESYFEDRFTPWFPYESRYVYPTCYEEAVEGLRDVILRYAPRDQVEGLFGRYNLGTPPPPAPVPRIYFAIGVARCGKSTYARDWWLGGKMPDVPGPRVVWSTDSLRLVHTGERFVKQTEDFVHLVKRLAIASHVQNGATVFVDGTHTTERSIKELLEIDPNAHPVLFDHVSKETCIDRARLTDQLDLLPVIERQHAQMTSLLKEDVDDLMDRLRGEVDAYKNFRWGNYECPN